MIGKTALRRPRSASWAKAFASAFIFLFDLALFFLSAVKNHSYVIQADESVAKPEFLDFLCSDLPQFLASYGQGFLVSLPFLVAGFLVFLMVLCGVSLKACVLGIALLPFLWGLVGHAFGVSLWVEAVLYSVSLLGILGAEGGDFLSGSFRAKGFTYPLCIALLLNSYIVYTLLTVDDGPGYIAVLASFLVASLVIRITWLRLRSRPGPGNVLLLLILALALCGVFLLSMSYIDFVESADNGGAWRTLYYLLVIAIMMVGHIMPVMTDLLRTRDKNGSLFGHRSGLWINAVCVMVLPLMCALSVHGVVVLVVAPLLSLASCLYAIYRPYLWPFVPHKERCLVASLLSALTIACMFVDPVVYVSPEHEMNALIPALASVLGATALAATRRLYLDEAQDRKTDFVDAVVDVLTARSSFKYPEKAQIMILAADALTIAIFVLLFTAYQFSQSASSSGAEVFAPVLGGVGGLYRFSWATVPAAVNVLVVDVARILDLRYATRRAR